MKTLNLILLLSALLVFSGCGKKTKTEQPVSPGKISLIIGDPLDYGLKNTLIFPVGANYNPQIFENNNPENKGRADEKKVTLSFSQNEIGSFYDRNASSEYFNKDDDVYDIRNILFYDKAYGSTYRLTTDTIHILSFSLHKEFARPMIFFRVVKKDINQDKFFNSKDAVMLFVSDLDGKNLVQITPENEQLEDYFYYPETGIILIKTLIDIDKDKKFTFLDETNYREMKLATPAPAREIFTKSLKDSLKKQMNLKIN